MSTLTNPTDATPTLRVGIDDTSLPVEEVLQGRGFITGKSGSGKSNTVSVVAEGLLADGYPLLLFDIDGEYVSLKEQYDILHVGGDEFCEKRIGPEHAEALAEIGLDRRQPIIVDLGGYVEDEEDAGDDEVAQSEVVAAVARAFFDRASAMKRTGTAMPYLLVVEEMQEFVPQQGGLGAAGRKLVKVGKRGRSRGLGIVGVSQRPASVDKNFITQCDWIVWHRLTWNRDTQVAGDILGSDYAGDIEDLSNGEAFLQTDWDERVQRVQMRRRTTTDLGGAPGLDGGEAVEYKETDTSILDELDEAAEQARTKQARIAQLERRVEELKTERDEWQERYEDAEYVADVSADVLGGMTGQRPTDTVTVDVDGATFDVPESIQANVLEIRQDKRAAESLAEDYREMGTAIWDAYVDAVTDPERVLPGEVQEDLAAYESFISEFAELTERHSEVVGTNSPDLKTGADASRLRRRAERAAVLEDRVEELEADLEAARDGEVALKDHDILSLLEHDAITRAINIAAEDSDRGDEHFPRVLRAVAVSEQPLSAKEAARLVDKIGVDSVRVVLNDLQTTGLVERHGSHPAKYGVSREFIEKRIRASGGQNE